MGIFKDKATGLLQKLGSNKLVAKQLVKRIPKEELLEELKVAWSSTVSRNSDTEEEVRKALDRIRKANYESIFKAANITEEDLRQVIEAIKAGKDVSFKREAPKLGRNDLCSCGSGKKYKRCCGYE